MGYLGAGPENFALSIPLETNGQDTYFNIIANKLDKSYKKEDTLQLNINLAFLLNFKLSRKIMSVRSLPGSNSVSIMANRSLTPTSVSTQEI